MDQPGGGSPRPLVLVVCEGGLKVGSSVQGVPLRPIAARPASWVRSGSGL